jgi:hypothetical protein
MDKNSNILFNASIMHIDPQRNVPAICAGHIVLTFIANTIEPVLTSNSLHLSEPSTSEPSSTQPEPDDKLNLLYPAPPPFSTANYDKKLGMSSNYHLDNTEQANNEETQDHNIYLSTTYL